LITIVFVESATEAIGKELGAVPVIADAQAPDQVADAVGRANPVVIADQLTAIGWVDVRHFDRDFALANRLRTEGIVLRYGTSYGPDTTIAPGKVQFEMVRKRELGWRPAHPSWRPGFVAA
jgi:hypothetical protein